MNNERGRDYCNPVYTGLSHRTKDASSAIDVEWWRIDCGSRSECHSQSGNDRAAPIEYWFEIVVKNITLTIVGTFDPVRRIG